MPGDQTKPASEVRRAERRSQDLPEMAVAVEIPIARVAQRLRRISSRGWQRQAPGPQAQQLAAALPQVSATGCNLLRRAADEYPGWSRRGEGAATGS